MNEFERLNAPVSFLRKIVCILFAAVLAVKAFGVEPPKPYGPVPTRAQLVWHEIEVYGLVHFNMPTFTDEEWAYGDKPPSLFNPTDFSADQIVKSAKAGGLKGLILVCKHHGGLCLWPTRTTGYSIKNSPWKGGKGDIVGDIAKATRKQGLKFGTYLSPWDRNHPEYGRPGYVEVYKEQWRELMTNYGALFELWVDGANGGTGWYGGAKGKRLIDRATYYRWPEIFEMMKKMQPGAVVFSDIGPGCRWVGNEHGRAGDPCWATITYPLINGKPASPGSIFPRGLLESGVRNGTKWIPAEADVSIRPGWFYHAEEDSKVRSPKNLIGLYFQTVGRGASLNIGISPDRRGRLHENDVDSLKKFGDWLKATFESNIAGEVKVIAGNVRGGSRRYAADNMLDGKADTYWCTDDSELTPEVIFDMGKDVEFNIVNIREYLPLGQRVEDWALDAWKDGKWVEFAKGTAIGNRRLVRTDYLTAGKVRLRITKAAACPAIREFSLHRESEWARKNGDSRDESIHGVGQDSSPVGKEARIFAPGIVSTKEHNEFCCTFSADGKEFYFNRGMTIMVSRRKSKGNGWTEPTPVMFTEGFHSHEPHITLDNKRLFYGSMRPRPGFPNEKQPYGIWMTERTPRGWGKPVYVGYAMYVTTTRTGVIYVTDVRGASNREQGIAKTTLKNGAFAPLVRQKGGVAVPAPDRLPGRHPCIAADESFIIFDAYEKKTEAHGKLFVSFREGENQWGPAIQLGDNVNKCEEQIAASISPDGKYLFYCCGGDIYWVDMQVIHQLKIKR